MNNKEKARKYIECIGNIASNTVLDVEMALWFLDKVDTEITEKKLQELRDINMVLLTDLDFCLEGLVRYK